MIYATSDIETKLWTKYKLICGVDEVGRGCFAGPVVAGAVIFSPECVFPEGIADSKLLKPKVREELAKRIEDKAEAWAIGEVDVQTINELGIGKATQIAFQKAVNSLDPKAEFIIIDAFYIDYFDKIFQLPIKNGDKLSVSIAAASIIAKVYRDKLMEKLEEEYPDYGFAKHKGYGTKEHRDALKKKGLSPIHRTSFNLDKFLI